MQKGIKFKKSLKRAESHATFDATLSIVWPVNFVLATLLIAKIRVIRKPIRVVSTALVRRIRSCPQFPLALTFVKSTSPAKLFVENRCKLRKSKGKLSITSTRVSRALVLYVFIAVVHVGVVVKEELVRSDKRLTVDIINSGAIRASSPCSTGLVDFVDRVSLALCNLLVEQVAIAAILEELIIIGKLLVWRVLRSCQVVVELLNDHISVVIE